MSVFKPPKCDHCFVYVLWFAIVTHTQGAFAEGEERPQHPFLWSLLISALVFVLLWWRTLTKGNKEREGLGLIWLTIYYSSVSVDAKAETQNITPQGQE